MRKEILANSVRRLLDDDETLIGAVYVWNRHRLMIPFVTASFLGFLVFSAVIGFESWPSRVTIAVGGAGIALASTTNYRVVARTSTGVLLCRGSRIRQVATSIVDRLPADTPFVFLGSNLVLCDWSVGDRRYTTTRNAGERLRAIAPPPHREEPAD